MSCFLIVVKYFHSCPYITNETSVNSTEKICYIPSATFLRGACYLKCFELFVSDILWAVLIDFPFYGDDPAATTYKVYCKQPFVHELWHDTLLRTPCWSRGNFHLKVVHNDPNGDLPCKDIFQRTKVLGGITCITSSVAASSRVKIKEETIQ